MGAEAALRESPGKATKHRGERGEAMSPLKKSNNIAARMGRWSASHWKTAVFGWLAFVIAALVVGQQVGTRQINQNNANVGQSHKADTILLKAGFHTDPQTEIVVVQSSTLTAGAPAFRAVVGDVASRVERFRPLITNLRTPYQPGNAGQISADGHTVMVEWDMKGTNAVATKRIDEFTTATAAVQKAHPGFYVGEAGSISSGKALNDAFASQLAKAGERSIPLTMLILLLVFGAVVAAGLPLLLALSAVLATLGLVALPSHLVPMDQNISAVVLLVGLAVGVDYSLFYLKREREERAAGKSSKAAIEAAAATSGRSVLISGITVMIAMAGMLFSGDKTYLSFGIATMIVVAVAMLGSLTVLPALLSRLGDKVNRARVPWLHRLQRPGGGRATGWVLDRVLHRPVASVVVAGGILLALALPALHLRTVVPGAEAFPKNLEPVRVYHRLQAAFPGEPGPAVVVVKAPSIDATK